MSARQKAAGVGVLAAIVTIIGSIGAWATYQGRSEAGTDANRGKTVAIAAGVALLLLLISAAVGWRWLAALAVIAGGVSAGLVIWSLSNIDDFGGAPAGIHLGRGWGIWMATIGSIILVLAALATTFSHAAPTAAPAPPPSSPPPASPPPAAPGP